ARHDKPGRRAAASADRPPRPLHQLGQGQDDPRELAGLAGQVQESHARRIPPCAGGNRQAPGARQDGLCRARDRHSDSQGVRSDRRVVRTARQGRERQLRVMKIFGDLGSGNCLKVKYTADYLRLPYTWLDLDILKGETRTAQFLAKFPMGRIPAVEFDDGRRLAESNAIIRYLARGSALLPDDGFAQAKIDELLFWEQ